MSHTGNKYPQSEQVRAIKRHLAYALAERTDIAAVYLLGSAAKGALRKDSDIDIALLPVAEQDIPLQCCLELASVLELSLGRPADIGVITINNLIYASEAILSGLRILTLQKDYTEAMETRLLGCYLTFRQDRKEVEDSYAIS